jgi:hypothetical protein
MKPDTHSYASQFHSTAIYFTPETACTPFHHHYEHKRLHASPALAKRIKPVLPFFCWASLALLGLQFTLKE